MLLDSKDASSPPERLGGVGQGLGTGPGLWAVRGNQPTVRLAITR